ncbi:hypothetical protein ACSMFR_05960 [Listeria aquatica]|uniref:hypothetical protein n=1 Tax=Listeria aquatica TaxID=1494960 RepID=UPI003F6EC216
MKKRCMSTFVLLLLGLGIFGFPVQTFAAGSGGKEPSYGINIQQILFWIAAVVVVIAILFVLFSIYRMVKLKRTRKIWWSIFALLLVIVVALNLAVNSF